MLVRCVAILLFFSLSLFSSVCVFAICYIYTYVSFSVLWAQLPELNDMMIIILYLISYKTEVKKFLFRSSLKTPQKNLYWSTQAGKPYWALCGQMPTYLADDIHLVSEGNRRSLRSSSDNMCAVPRTHNSFGDRSFGAAGPRI